MAALLSSDLRERIVKAVAGCASYRQAAERFGVSPTTAILGCKASSGDGQGRRSREVLAGFDGRCGLIGLLRLIDARACQCGQAAICL